MHLLIPFAAPSTMRCRAALPQLQLPALAALLQQLTPSATLHGHADDLSPLHERLQGRALGLPETDGLIPWAAHDAALQGLAPDTPGDAATGWAHITPCHVQANADHVAMGDPGLLQLSDTESNALLSAMQPYFAEDGIALHPLSHGTWLAHGAAFANLPTASLDRVVGTAIDPWMPRQTQAKSLRRLQNEMQMLLYTHPVNDARSARGMTTVNSFWISGTGPLPSNYHPTATHAPELQCERALHHAAQNDDAYAWVHAWQTLDASTIAALGLRVAQKQALSITLCGAQRAQTFSLQPRSVWARLRARFTSPSVQSILQSL